MLSFGRGALLSLLWGHGVQAAVQDALALSIDLTNHSCKRKVVAVRL